MYFQPIKNEDPHLDFYTMYKREATEYDTEYINKYNEDLNTTLIFVSFSTLPPDQDLHTSSGRSVLRSQFCFRHRCPVEARARFRRTVGSLSPCDPPQPQPVYCAQRRPYSPPCMEWTPHRNHYNLEPPICKPFNVAVGRVCRNIGQAVAEPLPPAHWWING